jgi:hypothetical protein
LVVVLILPNDRAGATSGQLPNLNEPAPKPRFEVRDRTWPTSPDKPEICLWKDDKLAALSITIDDNCGPDVDWWLARSAEEGIPLTWFVITGRIGGANAFDLTWPKWAEVAAKGHGVESHTVMHLHVDKPEWQGIEWEYEHSRQQIRDGMPGHEARFLAYPGGPNKKINDRNLAAKHYAAVRGAVGKMNPANQIDYLDVFAMSAPNLGGEQADWANLRKLLIPGSPAYRGWAVIVHHMVKDREALEPYFEFFREHQKDLWIGRFGDVAKYGQQRDTASVKVVENSNTRVALEVSDRMADAAFDFPLTIKVRLPSGWLGASALQNGHPARTRVVEHDRALFALVDVRPDQGTVVLEAAGAPSSSE